MSTKPPIAITLGELRLPGELHVDYIFTNLGYQPYFVYACICAKPNQPLPHQAYTSLREQDQTLHLFLGVAPIPKGLRVYAKIIPYAWLLYPGERRADFINLPFPIPEWHPYADPQQSRDVETVQVRRLVLSTEYFAQDQLLRPAEWDSQARCFKAHGVQTQRLEETLELQAPVPVLKRRDAFDRF